MSQRIELLPGVFLRAVRTEKFKTACFSVNFLGPMSRTDAPLNALTPAVLLRGTRHHPDIQSISMHLDDLYGASFGALVRKKGDVLSWGFFGDFIEDQFAPAGTEILAPMTRFLQEVLLEPRLEGGCLRQDAVAGEQQNLLNAIDARMNDKRGYATWRMQTAMYDGDPAGIPRLGLREDAENITAQSLTKFYRRTLEHSQVELFYMGRMAEEQAAELLRTALSGLPRGDIRPIETHPLTGSRPVQSLEERMDVTQCKLSMGLRTNCTVHDANYPALLLLNTVFGSGVSSKLFTNVREKLSLCYYADAALDKFKGVQVISSGIESDQAERAQAAILQELSSCANGDITDAELENARKSLLSALKASQDAPGRIDDFYLGQTIAGQSDTMDDFMEQLRRTTKAQTVAAAERIALDTVFFLRGPKT